MISKKETPDEVAETDSTRLAAILRTTLTAFVEQVQKRGLQPPIEVRVTDKNWTPLRTFRIGEKWEITAGRSCARKSSCAFPIKILATDKNKRMARARIAADSSAWDAEFLN